VPDVVVVGGGIIGAACARELALRGASVILLEKDELAAGASGRNLGYIDTSKDPVLAPLARESLAVYLEVVGGAPFPAFLDHEPLGTVTVSLDADGLDELDAWVKAAAAVGVAVERLDGDALRELEPELSHGVLDAWLLHEGHRVDPAALTVCLASDAREHGATIRHHAPARWLLADGGRVTGVMTDDGPIHAGVTLVAAGPWSGELVRPLGIPLAIAGARGWLVRVAPERTPVRHWIQSGARRLLTGPEAIASAETFPTVVPLREFAEGAEAHDVSPMIQPAPDGSIVLGTSREPALAADAAGLTVPRSIAREAMRLIPSLAGAPVVATWSGVRPLSPDERPLIGPLAEGLFVATGHGSEGVILGGGTAGLVAAMVLGEEPPVDPVPFDPARFRPARSDL
jgi:sarcosine oxidase subunit beta